MNPPNIKDRRLYDLELAPTLPSSIISLMLPSERDILFSIAKNYYGNQGDIIDAGIFMGASTFCFAKGLTANPKYDGSFHIHSYEKAIVRDNMARSLAIREKIGEPGSDFSAYLRRSLSPLGHMVKLHFGDITTMSYEGRVEVLFLDILKTRSIFRNCNTMFMSRLTPGHSLVVQQDYYWNENWYINAYMELLSEYFEIVDSAETSCVFVNTKAIPSAMYEADPLDSLTPTEITRLLEKSRDRASTMFQYTMSDLCIIEYAMESKSIVLAENRIKEFERRFGNMVSEWREGSKRRAWVAYTTLSRRIAQLQHTMSAGKRAAESMVVGCRIAEMDQENPAAHAHLANHYFRNGDLGTAEESLLRAVTLAPADAKLRYRLAVVMTRRGVVKNAIAHARRAVLLAPDNETFRTLLSKLEAEQEARSRSDIMMRFESLGENCEFGFAQRAYGAEPLSLFRWCGVPFNALLKALQARFEGLGDPENVTVPITPRGQFRVDDKAYGFRGHSLAHDATARPDVLQKRECERLTYLKRKLIEDLEDAEKIFIYRTRVRFDDAKMMMLVNAVRAYGPNTVMFVSEADQTHESGHVELIREGLLKGYVSRLAADAHRVSRTTLAREWHRLCVAAYRVRRANRAGIAPAFVS